MKNIDVLIVGAGPTGLMMAIELLRNGIGCRIIDKNDKVSERSKALVVQIRTLEIFDDLGIVEKAIAQSQRIEGAHFTADNWANIRLNLQGILEVESPYRSPIILEQYKTEKLLIEYLEKLGGHVERKVELVDFEQNNNSVSVTLAHEHEKQEKLDCRWLIGCDGAHSFVRHKLGLSFDGCKYEDEFILADVDAEWSTPQNQLRGFISKKGLFVALPMYGEKHYRLITVRRGFHGKNEDPTLEEVQQITKDLVHEEIKIKNPRWISYFVIHCRGVDRYMKGRVFVAGDAAHIHSPAGGQGMNTGIQDAYNLGWKIALVAKGISSEKLLESYHEERYPIGKFLLKNTDRAFRMMIQSGLLVRIIRNFLAPAFIRLGFIKRRAARIVSQLAIHYKSSSIVAEQFSQKKYFSRRPRAGERAPDALFYNEKGETTLFTLLRGTHHALFLCPGNVEGNIKEVAEIKNLIFVKLKENVRVYVVLPKSNDKTIWDNFVLVDKTFCQRYEIHLPSMYLIRPDGHISFCSQPIRKELLEEYLSKIFVQVSASHYK